MTIYILGNNERPAGAGEIENFRKQLKKFQEDGTEIVTHYDVTIISDSYETLNLLERQLITNEEAKKLLFPKPKKK